VVPLTPRPGVSLSERLHAHVENLAFIQHALEAIAEKDKERSDLSKTAAARAGALVDALRADVALLPRRVGRPLAEIPPSFRQEVLRLHREYGWGRPRIVRAMRVFEPKMRGVDYKVRRVLADAAGEKPSARRRAR
jgi:hypothetical protein